MLDRQVALRRWKQAGGVALYSDEEFRKKAIVLERYPERFKRKIAVSRARPARRFSAARGRCAAIVAWPAGLESNVRYGPLRSRDLFKGRQLMGACRFWAVTRDLLMSSVKVSTPMRCRGRVPWLAVTGR